MQGITKSRVAVRELLMEVLHELLGVGNVVVRNTHSEVAVVHRLSKRQLEDLDIWPCREMGKRGAKKGWAERGARWLTRGSVRASK